MKRCEPRPRPGLPDRNDQLGFTLIELSVVMVFMGVLMALAAPAWKTYQANQEDRSAAAAVVSMMRNAHVRATSEATSYRVDIDAANRQLTLLRYDGTAYVVRRTEKLDGAKLRLDEVAFTNSAGVPTSAYFYARGTASPGKVVLKRADRDLKHTITVEGLTGRVSTD
jgi:type IV fimbrial biogenesis protein FimT